MKSVATVDRVRYHTLTTSELRESFLVQDLFRTGEVCLVHWESERTIIGSAVPAATPLQLLAPAEIKAEYFLDRRELGIANLGAAGTVTVDGTRHALASRDHLYVGRGAREITFASDDAASPARFYLVSHPAHATYPTTRVTPAECETVAIGSGERASARTLRRAIHARGVKSCQLVMGITDLESGSVWNTSPPHTHHRRTEIYLYFDLPAGDCVLHVMGPPSETRNLFVRDGEAVLSPPWSMHFGAGSCRYAFVWSMGGENQEFEDMQGVKLEDLR